MCRIRTFVVRAGMIAAVVLAPASVRAAEPPVKKVAGIATIYRHNSHADVIFGRLLQTDTLDGQGRRPRLQLVSLYVDQVPKNDLSRELAAKHGFELCDSVPQALTLGTDQLAVDGVIIVAEHGEYPKSPTDQTIWPKRRFFSEVVQTFDKTGRVVPIFSDKHLADNTADAVWIYETARTKRIPLMAGSSVPTTWRKPAVDVQRDAKMTELLVVSYGGLDSYGFHGMDFLQSLAERRAGDETGVASVRCFAGDDFWKAAREGVIERAFLDAVVRTSEPRARVAERPLEDSVKEPVGFRIAYRDDLTATMCHLNGAVSQWAAGWKSADGSTTLVRADLQEDRPFMHFTHMLAGIESMIHTGQPAWPVERTLFSSAMLHAGMTSKTSWGEIVLTPELDRRYRSTWNWAQPEERGR
jgi:hypothetical protein